MCKTHLGIHVNCCFLLAAFLGMRVSAWLVTIASNRYNKQGLPWSYSNSGSHMWIQWWEKILGQSQNLLKSKAMKTPRETKLQSIYIKCDWKRIVSQSRVTNLPLHTVCSPICILISNSWLDIPKFVLKNKFQNWPSAKAKHIDHCKWKTDVTVLKLTIC